MSKRGEIPAGPSDGDRLTIYLDSRNINLKSSCKASTLPRLGNAKQMRPASPGVPVTNAAVSSTSNVAETTPACSAAAAGNTPLRDTTVTDGHRKTPRRRTQSEGKLQDWPQEYYNYVYDCSENSWFDYNYEPLDYTLTPIYHDPNFWYLDLQHCYSLEDQAAPVAPHPEQNNYGIWETPDNLKILQPGNCTDSAYYLNPDPHMHPHMCTGFDQLASHPNYVDPYAGLYAGSYINCNRSPLFPDDTLNRQNETSQSINIRNQTFEGNKTNIGSKNGSDILKEDSSSTMKLRNKNKHANERRKANFNVSNNETCVRNQYEMVMLSKKSTEVVDENPNNPSPNHTAHSNSSHGGESVKSLSLINSKPSDRRRGGKHEPLSRPDTELSRPDTVLSRPDTAFESLREYDDVSVTTLMHIDTSTPPPKPPSHPPPDPPVSTPPAADATTTIIPETKTLAATEASQLSKSCRASNSARSCVSPNSAPVSLLLRAADKGKLLQLGL